MERTDPSVLAALRQNETEKRRRQTRFALLVVGGFFALLALAYVGSLLTTP